jgi:hypothetical protein
MALSFSHSGVLVIVLGMDNIERILENDPFVFDGRKVPIPLALKVPLQVMICYAGEDEVERIHSMTGKPEELWAYLTRGWKIGPGDEDGPYKKL